MSRLPDDFIKLIGSKNPLEDLLREDGHFLSPTGEGFKCSSPFNPDSDPSCHLNTSKQVWSDFSGGEQTGGGVIQYVMLRDGIGFLQAVMLLCKRARLKLPSISEEEFQAQLAFEKESTQITKWLTDIAEFCHVNLPKKIRKEALNGHYGLTDDIINRFKIGYVDGNVIDFVKKELKLTNTKALATGMFTFHFPALAIAPPPGQEPDYDSFELRCSFHERILFPYLKRGKVVYAAARIVPGSESDAPKYLKLLTHDPKKHPYISKTVRNDHFFNEDAAKGGGDLVVTEGVTDLLSAEQAGLACISPVTTSFRGSDAEKLVGLCKGVERVTIINDNEENASGEKGALKTAKLLHEARIKVFLGVVPRPSGVTKIDVNSLVKDKGTQALVDVVNTAKSYTAFLIDKVDPNTPPDQLGSVLTPILESLAHHNEIECDAYKSEIEKRFPIKKRALNNIAKTTIKRVKREQRKAAKVSAPPTDRSLIKPAIELEDRQLSEVFTDALRKISKRNRKRRENYETLMNQQGERS